MDKNRTKKKKQIDRAKAFPAHREGFFIAFLKEKING